MATLGVVAPSLLVIMVLAWLFVRYQGAPQLQAAFSAIRPAVVVLILLAALSVGRHTITEVRSAVLALTVLALMLKTKINPILLLFASGIVGIFLF